MKPYTFDDVVAALNAVAPYDWKTFFDQRLDSTEPRAPLGGIEGGGWKLVFTDELNDYQQAAEADGGAANLELLDRDQGQRRRRDRRRRAGLSRREGRPRARA